MTTSQGSFSLLTCAPALLLAIACGCATRPPAETSAGPSLDALKAKASEDGKLLWYDARDLGLEGQGWTDLKRPYDRFPGRAEGVIPDPVWSLSRHSAGICCRFVTDSTTISARWSLLSDSLAMNHMPATGVSGVDLYVKQNGQWG